MKNVEAERVSDRYERRKAGGVAGLYDPFRTVNLMIKQERERSINRLLGYWLKGRPLSDMKIVEVGCGSGTNLLHLIMLGASSSNIIANELLPDRIAATAQNLPSAIEIMPGDASLLEIRPGSIDIVVQSTVFSSLLDPAFRATLAETMMSWMKPGACILWYDFIYNNPRNPDVQGMPLTEVARLFPSCRIKTERVTLAPPIARRLGFTTRLTYPMLNILPFLRTHVVCLIEKPNS